MSDIMAEIGVNIAILQDDKILLIKREDFEVWCLPGGGLDPGESVAQAASREAREETGLKVDLTRLIGVYTRTGNGESFDHIVLFAAQPIGGSLMPQEGEALDVRYFSADAIPEDLVTWHLRRIQDAFSGAQGLAWRQDYPLALDHHLSRQDLYDMRDCSGLERVDFFKRYFGNEGENTLEVGDHVGG